MPKVIPDAEQPAFRIYLSYDGRVSPYIIAAVRKACDKLPEVTPLKHNVRVLLHKSQIVMDPSDRTYSFGLFDSQYCRIDVAAGIAPTLRKLGDTKEQATAAVVHTLVHEFVHYEQYRDGRELTERGVNLRAKKLMQQLGMGSGR
jgi:hypothetical protein